MLKHRVLILFLVTLFAFVPYGDASAPYPEWLHGKVAIDLYGDDRQLGAWPYERYICIFDLDNDQIDSIKIPDESVLLKEWGPDGKVVFAYPHTAGFNYIDDYCLHRWREYEYVPIIPVETESGTKYKRGESNWDEFLNEGSENGEEGYDKIYAETIWMRSPLTILGLSGNDTYIYDYGLNDGLYLAYGISNDGEMEIQLQKYEKDTCTVLYHFPLDYDFGAWQYAISPVGDIAWRNNQDELYCAKGDTVLFANVDIGHNKALTWKDDMELLFFVQNEKDDEYVLKKWNISTGTFDVYLDSEGREIHTDVFPWSMSINDAEDILAVYGPIEKRSVIQFIQLTTGESYTMYPWTIENTDKRDGFSWYGISDQGVMYYSSGYLLQSRLLWVSD